MHIWLLILFRKYISNKKHQNNFVVSGCRLCRQPEAPIKGAKNKWGTLVMKPFLVYGYLRILFKIIKKLIK